MDVALLGCLLHSMVIVVAMRWLTPLRRYGLFAARWTGGVVWTVRGSGGGID
jgi:hypothetical protein